MKASLKLREDRRNPLLKAKIPINVVGLPFLSSVTAGDPSDLSFSLRTSCDAGPSLDFSYKPHEPVDPFSLTLKSGVGVFGSPRNSPLILSARCSLVGRSDPSFSIQFRPHFGNFFLKRTALSSPIRTPKENGEVPVLSDFNSAAGFFSGVSVSAITGLPVTKRSMVNVRWGVNFPADLGRKLPFLSVEKISVESVEDAKAGRGDHLPAKKNSDVEILKGVCVWMGRELDALRFENRIMKESIADLKSRFAMKNQRAGEVLARKSPEVGDFGEFDGWRKKRNGGMEVKSSVSESAASSEFDGQRKKRNGGIEGKNSVNRSTASEMEEEMKELKKAIEAATS